MTYQLFLRPLQGTINGYSNHGLLPGLTDGMGGRLAGILRVLREGNCRPVEASLVEPVLAGHLIND